LRSPLVDGKAVMLRHGIKAQALRFDAARLVDLGGGGIRGLDVWDGRIWGIAGHAQGSSAAGGGDRYMLWYAPLDALRGDSSIDVEQATVLPNHSEGLAISDGYAYVVNDGGAGRQTCALDSGYVLERMPAR
jgi:hypothetical protein